MNYYLPTYDECVRICNEPDSPFYENKHIVDGYNISLFNYRITLYDDFKNPIKSDNSIDAFELRGLAFVFNRDGTVFNRFLLLQKFFNVNQVTDTQYDVIKDYTIKDIHNKEDGSVASFIQLPNGKVIGKSKMSFTSSQADGINRVYSNDKEIKEFVDWSIENNYVAVFEYVAPNNRIVLRYDKEDLILLRLRDNNTGQYLDLADIPNELRDKIRIADTESTYTLDQLIDMKETVEDKEGWVVHSIDDNGLDFFYKIKTDWYFELHNLFTNDLYREHILIKYILNDEIDDIITQIPPDEVDSLDRVDKITRIVRNEVNRISNEIRDLYNIYKSNNLSIRDFAIKYKKNSNFSQVMYLINRESDESVTEYNIAVRYLLGKYNRLEITREWLMTKDKTLFDN